MAGALEIMHAQRRAERKNAGGAPENKARVTAGPNAPPRLPGLAIASSRFSSKGARAVAIANRLAEADFAGVTPSGQQDRYTIADVEAIVAGKTARARAGQ